MPYEVEHIYPDYSLYPGMTKGKAYGFLTRGCPRGCAFCHVKDKEGKVSRKVADLTEFWDGQKEIVLCDPNILACSDWRELLMQLKDSKAYVDFTQGVDIRLMTEEKAEIMKSIKVKHIHFAWDRYEDREIIIPKLQAFKEITGWPHQKMGVFMLTNYQSTFEQDLERVYAIRDLGYSPYVMIYEKHKTKPTDKVRRLQRWVNCRKLFGTVKRFEDVDWFMRRKKGDDA